MSKKIEDYLHLYLGCEVECKGERFTLAAVRSQGGAQLYETGKSGVWVFKSNIKPFLRKLDSMTGKEVIEAFHLSYSDSKYQFSEFRAVNNNEFGWVARNQNGMECFLPANSFTPEVFQYLLKQGIDLFGLIEAGLAIASPSPNTLTPHPSTPNT